MGIRHFALSAAIAAGITALMPAAASAQYYYAPWCNAFPLTWPFCIVGAAAYVVTTPIRALAPPPYYAPPPYAAAPYAASPYAAAPYAPPPPPPATAPR